MEGRESIFMLFLYQSTPQRDTKLEDKSSHSSPSLFTRSKDPS